eukprot:TRINITY_DN3042_c0_g1_i1.p1 TRINITY_DN3042_c0_g1~~TRINITY_DN3042_c0_g1_i1.p1  ORF type:complete len:306 (-),score=75.61 TRINITY_DN3042_c0_g1_i1:20-937(-)
MSTVRLLSISNPDYSRIGNAIEMLLHEKKKDDKETPQKLTLQQYLGLYLRSYLDAQYKEFWSVIISKSLYVCVHYSKKHLAKFIVNYEGKDYFVVCFKTGEPMDELPELEVDEEHEVPNHHCFANLKVGQQSIGSEELIEQAKTIINVAREKTTNIANQLEIIRHAFGPNWHVAYGKGAMINTPFFADHFISIESGNNGNVYLIFEHHQHIVENMGIAKFLMVCVYGCGLLFFFLWLMMYFKCKQMDCIDDDDEACALKVAQCGKKSQILIICAAMILALAPITKMFIRKSAKKQSKISKSAKRE